MILQFTGGGFRYEFYRVNNDTNHEPIDIACHARGDASEECTYVARVHPSDLNVVSDELGMRKAFKKVLDHFHLSRSTRVDCFATLNMWIKQMEDGKLGKGD